MIYNIIRRLNSSSVNIDEKRDHQRVVAFKVRIIIQIFEWQILTQYQREKKSVYFLTGSKVDYKEVAPSITQRKMEIKFLSFRSLFIYDTFSLCFKLNDFVNDSDTSR